MSETLLDQHPDADAPAAIGFEFDDVIESDRAEPIDADDVEAVVVGEHGDRDTESDEDTVPGDSKNCGPRNNRHRLRAQRALIRRAVQRSQDLAAADGADRDLLAAVLGADTDLPVLTAAVFTAPRSATAALDDLLALHGLDRGDQMAEVAFMERARALSLWGLLTELGAVDRKRPAVDIAAAKATVNAIGVLSEATVQRVNRVIALIKGS